MTIPKKKIIFLVIGSIAVAVLLSILMFGVSRVLTDFIKVPFGSLYIWKLIAIFFSAYALVRPWGWKTKFQALTEKHPLTSRGENRFLILYCYLNFIAPVIYGTVLVFWGIPFSEYLFFAGASVLDSLAWGIFTYRKM